MDSFFIMWYDFIKSMFDTTGAGLTAETQALIDLITVGTAIFGVILSIALVYKLVKYIFFAIFSMGH